MLYMNEYNIQFTEQDFVQFTGWVFVEVQIRVHRQGEIYKHNYEFIKQGDVLNKYNYKYEKQIFCRSTC